MYYIAKGTKEHWKLLSIEQFRDDRARSLATKHFLTGLAEMFTRLFTGMMDKGLLRRDAPVMLAFAYTAPISALIHLCDRGPEKTEDAMAPVEAFGSEAIRWRQTMQGNRITADMIAPCGLDCSLCKRALAETNPCPGCHGPNEKKPDTNPR